jgi:hypothetical protein
MTGTAKRTRYISVPMLAAEWHTDVAFFLDQIRQRKLRAVDLGRAPRGRMPSLSAPRPADG